MILKSEIKSVTVYKDRALIERITKPNLSQGEHTLLFSGLPMGIDTNSVQLSGGKQSILQDLKVKDVYHEKVPDEKKNDILEEVEELEGLIAKINDRVNNSNEEKAFLLNLANVSSDSSKKSFFALFAPEKMNEMLKFYSEKLNALDDTIRNNKKEQKKLEKRLNILRNEIQKFSSSSGYCKYSCQDLIPDYI